ncbi:phage integrase family protein [Burkholderia ubonensis]|uniref:phage integrase family protein n=1 Tax=Burkholderia ubonensis TaxID=101571 RepID=UPI000A67376B|nr:phage integrase family protein [Burkholderia ubonensis]
MRTGKFAAVLRCIAARIQGIPAPTIARRFYDIEDSAVLAEADAVERHLATMRDALVNGSAALAEHLRASMCQHGQAQLTALTLRVVEHAAKLAAAAPAPDHALVLWLRPFVARHLTGKGIATLGELIAYCNRHRGSWWRPTSTRRR